MCFLRFLWIHTTFPPPLDRRSVGLFRVLLGITLLADLLWFRLPYLSAFFVDGGILPRALSTPVQRVGVLHVLTTAAGVWGLFAVTLVAYTLLTVGYKARLFACISLVCLWSIHQRITLILATDDQALICLLFWSLFLPRGARFAPFAARKATQPMQVRNLATCAMLVQLALIYVCNAAPKTGATWREGVALSYALLEDLWAKPTTAAWLAHFPALCRVLTYTIKPIEFAIPVLMFWPLGHQITRLLAVGLILAFHWGIFVFISLGFFPLITTTWAALLVPSWVWDRVGAHWAWCAGEMRRCPARSSTVLVRGWYALQQGVVLSVLLIMVWNAAQSFAGLRAVLPLPRSLAALRETSLFVQHWALYAPDATIVSKWVKVRVVQGEAPGLDAWTQRPFTYDNAELRVYHIEPWQNLAWVLLYQAGVPEALAMNWARYEYAQWRRRHPDQPIAGVQIVGFERTILGPLQTTPITWRVLAEHRVP